MPPVKTGKDNVMETRRYQLNEEAAVIQALKEGKVIAFPTDTVYGLGVVYDDEEALTRLKRAKVRPDEKPIPMMVSSIKQIEEVAYLSNAAKKLIHQFMPGAFTIVVKRKEEVPAYVSNGLDTIAIRMPDDAFVLGLMDKIGKPFLVSSANLSAHAVCSNSEDVMKQLQGRIDGVVEGNSKSDVASTIVDVTKETVVLLREGPISEEEIKRVLKEEI